MHTQEQAMPHCMNMREYHQRKKATGRRVGRFESQGIQQGGYGAGGGWVMGAWKRGKKVEEGWRVWVG